MVVRSLVSKLDNFVIFSSPYFVYSIRLSSAGLSKNKLGLMRFAHIDVTSYDESTHVEKCLHPRIKGVEGLGTSKITDRYKDLKRNRV